MAPGSTGAALTDCSAPVGLASTRRDRKRMNRRWWKRLVQIAVLAVPCILAADLMAQRSPVLSDQVDLVEVELGGFAGKPANPDDRFVIASLREAIAGSREGSGGIGACLVREDTGEIVERGHNRQVLAPLPKRSPRGDGSPGSLRRSDADPEADRWEGGNPRRMYEGLALYSS